jgi:glucokinase
MACRPRAILAGDIGGTKTTLAVVSGDDGLETLAEATFPSNDFPDLETIVSRFLSEAGVRVQYACFGVAGPVSRGRSRITNLPWVLDEERLRESLGLSGVMLINDLVAISTAVPGLGPASLRTLQAGTPEPGGAVAVVAPGTGLGEAFLVWDGARYLACPSEGGHADFAPRNDLEADLLRFVRERQDHVSIERVCSGLGIPVLYDFLRRRSAESEPVWLAERLANASDRTPVIIEAGAGSGPRSALCASAIELFASILGAEAGNLALKVLATGGVYIAGGIPPRILRALEGGTFLAAFRDKGRFRGLLEGIPVHVVIEPRVAIIGAARYLLSAGGATPRGRPRRGHRT